MKSIKKGYQKGSPESDRPFIFIDSGEITMRDVPHPVVGIDNKGNTKLMMPGGEYSFPGSSVVEIPIKSKGKGFSLVKKANLGMKTIVGDPIKHPDKVRAIGLNDETIYVPAGEGQLDDPENYLNLEKLDQIIQAPYPNASIPFYQFRDMVRTVEAGPNSADPYTQIQFVNTDDGPQPVRRELQPEYGTGAYQFDYQTAKTAYNRLKQIADKRDMDYPLITDEELMYPSELAPELQDMLFTAHFAKDLGSSVEQVLTDPSYWAENWYKGHYKGDDESRFHHFKEIQSASSR